MTAHLRSGIACGVLIAVTLTGACAPSASAPAPPSFDLQQDYTVLPDGPHPARFASGQEAVLTYTPDESALPAIRGGRSVIAYTGPGRGAGYATARLDDTVSYVEADWNFGPTGSTDGGQLALCLFAGPLPSGFLGDTPVPDSPAHVVFLNDHFEYGVWDHDNLAIVANVAYGKKFTNENQHVAVFVRKDLGKAWVVAPTGAIFGPFSDPAIEKTTAPYVTAEQFYSNAGTDRRVEIQRWHATSARTDVPGS